MAIVLETDRLIVREWSIDDADEAFVFLGDPEVTRYLGADGGAFPDVDFTRERLQTVIARGPSPEGYGNWAICEKATGTVIGGGGLVELEGGPDVEVFYHFRADRWGMGYATELTIGLIAYVFERTDLPRVVGLAYTENIASHRVMLRSGMTHQGMRHAYEHDLEYFVIDRPMPDQAITG